MKQQQPGLINGFLTSTIAWILTIMILVVTEGFKKIVWPLACFIAKLAWKGICHLLKKKSKVAKPSKPSPQLPTPDIFKNAPNLAPAKDVRF